MGASVFALICFYKVDVNKISVVFSSSFTPLVKCNIQKKEYIFLVDLGNCKMLSLEEDCLQELKKTNLNRVYESCDFKDANYFSEMYLVPEVQVLSNNALDHEIISDSRKRFQNTVLWPTTSIPKRKYHGRIGWSYFKEHAVLFDFSNSAIYLAENLESLEQEKSLNLMNYLPISFTVEKGVLMIDIETDLGKHKAILDTGATYSVIKTQKNDPKKIKVLSCGATFYKSNKFKIGEYNFGKRDFLYLDMPEIEGVIGSDFFLDHSVIFDFANQIVYIEKPKGILGTQWTRLKFHITQFLVKKFSNFPTIEDS